MSASLAAHDARWVDHLPRWREAGAGRVHPGSPAAPADASQGAPTATAREGAARNAAVAHLALLGTGAVGRALLARVATLSATHEAIRGLRFVAVANSRHRTRAASGAAEALAALDAGEHAPADLESTVAALGDAGRRIVIDATASDAVASRHAEWLANGLHVVTACKLGAGAALSRAEAIRAAGRAAGTRYGDAATVGAGLPILRTLRALRAGGERVHAIVGGLSGSLAWILSRWDGTRPLATLVEEARTRGYTEPDPRQDLAGDDVRRKLLILARAAGVPLQEHDAEVESLVGFDDAALAARACPGRVLRYVARWDAHGARAGLEALAPDDPLAQGSGTDNRIALWSDRYRDRPLILQGPGAGAHITAGALLDDVLAIVRET